MAETEKSFDANANQKCYDMPHCVDHLVEVTNIYFAEQVKKYKLDPKTEVKTVLKNKTVKVFLDNYKKDKDNKHKLNITVAEDTKPDLKKGDKVIVNWQERVDDGFDYQKINKIKVGKKLFVKALCMGDKAKLTIEIFENKLTNTEAVYDDPVKFLIGDAEKTKIEFNIKAFEPEYIQEITLKPKSKEDYKKLVDKFNKRKDKNAFLFLKGEVVDTPSDINFLDGLGGYQNSEGDRFEVSGAPCYCGVNFTVEEVKLFVKEIKNNTYYINEGKKYPITKLPYHSVNKIFHRNGFSGTYSNEVMADNTFENFTLQLNKMFIKYEINTCRRKMHFLSQMFVETMFFSQTVETDNKYTYRYDPYRGRGFLHLTWEENYNRYKKKTGVDIVTNYSLVATDMATAADTGGWYWRHGASKGDINPVADTGSVEKLTKYINAESKNLQERKDAFDTLIKIMEYDSCINKI
jgi:predicted chitinase